MIDGILPVVHSCPVWLPRTQAWLHDQVRWLPSTIESHIACEVAENLDAFPVESLHIFGEEPGWSRRLDNGLRRLRLRRHLAFLVRVARNARAGVIHSHFGHVAWADRGAAQAAGARHVATFYGADISQLPATQPHWRRRYRQLFESAACILCEGPHMRACAITLGCPESKAVVHHLGVNLEEIPFHPRSWAPDQPLRVLLAGTFREKKGLTFGLRALAAVRDRRRLALEITIIGDSAGKPGDREEKTRILQTLQRLGLETKCRLLGFQPHEVLTMEGMRHHIFLSPSVTAADGDTEGGAPVTILEMAAAGMPVVSSLHCDIPNIIENRVSGVLAPERSVDGLVECIEWLLDRPSSWETIATAARKRIATSFDSRKQCMKLAEIYHGLA